MEIAKFRAPHGGRFASLATGHNVTAIHRVTRTHLSSSVRCATQNKKNQILQDEQLSNLTVVNSLFH
jgi:hypothetical protein